MTHHSDSLVQSISHSAPAAGSSLLTDIKDKSVEKTLGYLDEIGEKIDQSTLSWKDILPIILWSSVFCGLIKLLTMLF